MKKGLTQKQLAERLNVNQSYVSKVETSSITTISIEFILNISKTLSLCPVDVFNFLIKDKCTSCAAFNCSYQDKYKNAR